MNILSVSLASKEGPQQLVESFKNTGFAVVTHHGIPQDLIQKVYKEWTDFFASEAKFDFVFDKATQSGYFPFKSENAKDSPIKDLKEFYHYYPNKDLPSVFSKATTELRDALLDVGKTLLHWLDTHSPREVLQRFSTPLAGMSVGSDRNLFRILHYPPLTGGEEAGAIRAAAHEDINLITLLPASTEMGLEVKDAQGKWHAVPGNFGDIVINVGDMLQEASGGFYKSTTHRVVNPAGAAAKRPRYSMPLFVHPRADVKLSERYTADAYLNQRLKEIGLI